MPRSRDYKLLKQVGRDQEKKYAWIAATESYRKVLTIELRLNNFSKAAETCERIGFCYQRGALQAENPDEFKNRMLLAIEGYRKAAELFEKEKNPKAQAKILCCKATATYIRSSLELDSAIRKNLLDKCWKLKKEALEFYKATNDPNLGKKYSELGKHMIDRLSLEWNQQERQKMLKEALSYGEEAIALLSEQDEQFELARAYGVASTHYLTGARGLELKKKKIYEERALSHSKKAAQLSEKLDDRFTLGMAQISLGIATINFSDNPDSAANLFENALQCGRDTKDNYLIGQAFYCLASLSCWKMIAEEDPEKIVEESGKCVEYSKNAIHHFGLISSNQEIASSYYWYAENYNYFAKYAETDSEKKRILFRRSIEAGRKGLNFARVSGSIRATWLILHPLSKSLFMLSTLETNADAKRRLLEESLLHREENIRTLKKAMPYFFWNHGVRAHYLALIQAELAKVERSKDKKVEILNEAIRSAENCINLCWKCETLSRGQYAALGGYCSDFGKILERLYQLTGVNDVLEKLIKLLKRAVEAYKKANMPCRIAEVYWGIARAHNKSQKFMQSAKNFEEAARMYKVVAKKLPSLQEFYQDHASYMQAWSEIERARDHHLKKQYGQANEHYERAANLHKTTKRWGHFNLNYLALAQMEKAEDLSRREQTKESISLFQKAARSFTKSKRMISSGQEKIESRDGFPMGERLAKTSDLRRQYCLGRVALEEAKILDRQGNHAASSAKYAYAASKFQEAISSMEKRSDRHELRPIIELSKAWQMMTRAEAEASPNLYLKASKFFDKAKEYSLDENARMLALGHSSFCKALEAGTRFEAIRNEESHLATIRHLESASTFYIKAGFKIASEYAKATQRLFDAYVYVDKAQTETNPIRKIQQYQMAEKLLRASARSYSNAMHFEKSEEVQRLLESVKEDQQLAISLADVLQAPTMASTTTSFATPTPAHERAVGLERFEHAVVEAHLTTPEDVTIGEEFYVQLDLVNVAKNYGLLVRVDNLVPPGFEAISSPSRYVVENGSIDLKGKKLDPLTVESIKRRLQATQSGATSLSPPITYVDEEGKFKACKPKPANIFVHPKLTFEFKTEAAQRAFNFLVKSFVEYYMKRRFSLEKSGWRTLMEIVRQCKVSKSSVYGGKGKHGIAITELERRGLVEGRVFPGERGRGGKILKLRIAYEKEPIERLVDQQIMKNMEK
ncbi:MAG: hypothetical protein JSV51_08775 [Candidatus Bathyarchaeota archaeon]|nr:MAG: hypothetical protein JSV51_08775 [Candidatus Bathyarchaeota archaeon]